MSQSSWRLSLFVLALIGSVAWAQDTAWAQDVERFVLHSFRADGGVEGKNAKLTIQLRAEAKSDELVRIPLRLDECIITEQQFTGDARQYLKDEGSRGGYAWYVQGKGKDCQLSLTVLVPLKVRGVETQLQFTAPQAQQAVSDLTLLVPGDMEAGKVLGGEQPEEPEKTADGTRFSFRRLSGPFTVSWHPRNGLVRAPGKLQARVFIKSRFDGANQEFRSEARITVLSTGGAFEGFQLRLPPGAALADDHPGAAAVPEATPPGQGQLIQVRHEPATRYTLALSLRHDLATKGATELARYEVLGAFRQRGFAAVEIDDTWHARWPSLDAQHVERIAASELPKEYLEEMKFAARGARAAFELFTAQASLRVSTSRSKPRVRVEPAPEYIVWVERDELRLNAQFRYFVDRMPLAQVQIDWPQVEEWEPFDVGPADIVQSYALEPPPPARKKTGRGTMTIDVKSATNSFAVWVKARRMLPPQGKEERKAFTFGLPQPQVTQSQGTSGRLWVQPADNIALAPETKSVTGLLETAALTRLPEPHATQLFAQAPLVYQADLSGAVRFAATAAVLPRRLAVRAEGEVTLENERIRVEQRFKYKLDHESLTEIALLLPAAVNGGEPLQIFLNDQRLDNPRIRELARKDKGPPKEAPHAVKRLELPSALRPGMFTLRLVHVRRWAREPAAISGEPLPVVLPLVMPADGELTENLLQVSARNGTRVRLGQSAAVGEAANPWQPDMDDDTTSPRDDVLRLRSDGLASEVALEVDRQTRAGEQKPIIESLRLRTEFGGRNDGGSLRHGLEGQRFASVRDDRLSCYVAGGLSGLRFKLPENMEGLRVKLNGQVVQSNMNEQHELVFGEEYLGSTSAQPQLLEIAYQVPQEAADFAAALDVAEPVGDGWVRESQWELIVPEDQHLWRSPAGLTREFAWRWCGWYFARVPLAGAAAASVSGGAGTAQGEESGANRYVFTRLGPLPALRVSLVHRTWLVMIASACAFAVGALWLYVPQVHRREVLLAGAVLLLALSLSFPEPLIVLAQAATLGIAAASGMALLKWLLPGGRPLSLRLGGGSAVGSSVAYELSTAKPSPAAEHSPTVTPANPSSKGPTVASLQQGAAP